jgi:hypothetical protein
LIPFQILTDLVALLALAAVPLLWAFWHLYLIGWNIH